MLNKNDIYWTLFRIRMEQILLMRLDANDMIELLCSIPNISQGRKV